MEKSRLDYTIITDTFVSVNGRLLEHESKGGAMLTELYRAHVGDWPKFFKMDTLSKVGFLASELLLKECSGVESAPETASASNRGNVHGSVSDRVSDGAKRASDAHCEEYIQSRAVVLFGVTGSLCANRNYQETIQFADNYYPSPALFVYTLPNIVTGEIAIRNRYRGETSFYVLDGYDAQSMAFHIRCAFQDSVTNSVLAGWVDSSGNEDFRSFFILVDRGAAAAPGMLENEIMKIMDKLK